MSTSDPKLARLARMWAEASAAYELTARALPARDLVDLDALTVEQLCDLHALEQLADRQRATLHAIAAEAFRRILEPPESGQLDFDAERFASDSTLPPPMPPPAKSGTYRSASPHRKVAAR